MMKRLFYVVLVLGVLVLNACENAVSDPVPDSTPPNEELITRITELKNDGILEKIEALQTDVPEGMFSDTDMDKVHLFLDKPDVALRQIAQEENGEAQLAIIDALFNEGTVDDVLQALETLSPEKADELENVLDELAEALQISNGEVILPEGIFLNRSATSAKPNIRQLKLRLSDKPLTPAYSASVSLFLGNGDIFSVEDMDWANVAAYTGVCAATVVASFLAESYLPWVSVPSTIVAILGAGAATLQLISWRDSEGLFDLLIGIIKENIDDEEELANTLNSSDEIFQILTVSAVTLVTAEVCRVTVIGRFITSDLIPIWESFLAKISNKLPDWLSVDIFGIIISSRPPITNPPPPAMPTRPKPKNWLEEFLDWLF